MDLFAPFLYIPEDVRRRVPLVTGANLGIVKEIYSVLGYDIKNLYQFPKNNDYVHINKMHTVWGSNQVNGHIGISLRKLRDKLKGPLKLDLIPPTKFVMISRKSKRRNIANFDALTAAVKKAYDYEWESINVEPDGLLNTAEFWNSVKLVFAFTGSTFGNSIFMQNTSVACILLANWYDTPAMKACLSYGISIFVSHVNQCQHFISQQCKVPENCVVELIGRAIAYIEKRERMDHGEKNETDVKTVHYIYP